MGIASAKIKGKMMRRLILYIGLYLLFTPLVFAQNYNKYEMELIKEFENGSEINEIKVGDTGLNPLDAAPTGMGIGPDGNIYIADYLNDRIAIVNDKTLEITDSIKGTKYLDSSKSLEVREDIILGRRVGYRLFGYKDGEEIYNVGFEELTNNTVTFTSVLYYNNIVFAYSVDRKIRCVVNPSMEKLDNKKRFRGPEKTREMFEPDSEVDVGELTIDENDRLFFEGKILNKDFRLFANYWLEEHKGVSHQQHIEGFTNEAYRKMKNNTYIGKDALGNTYWLVGSFRFIVINQNGWIIHGGKFDQYKSRTLPAVHPSGDIYFLDYDENGVYLYKIERRW